MKENKFLSGVYFYVTIALIVTGITSYIFGNTELIHTMYEIIPNEDGEGTHMSMSILGWVVTLAPLLIIFGLASILKRSTSTIMFIGLILFAVMIGMSLSYIFLIYTGSSIVLTFFTTASLFLILSLVGLKITVDLTNFGTFLMFALIGIIIAMIANWFIQNTVIHYIISAITILVFLGLTAYDTQKLKDIGSDMTYGSDKSKKLTLWEHLIYTLILLVYSFTCFNLWE